MVVKKLNDKYHYIISVVSIGRVKESRSMNCSLHLTNEVYDDKLRNRKSFQYLLLTLKLSDAVSAKCSYMILIEDIPG